MDRRIALWAVAAWAASATLTGCGCGAVASAQGKWLRVSPETGVPMGDYLVIEGDQWKMTGNPSFGGTVSLSDGRLQLILEQVGDQTRAEAIATPGARGVEDALKGLDKQLVFEIVEADGKTLLKQVGKGTKFAELRFERAPD